MNAKPNLRLCDENDAMQVEPSFEYVLTQIDSLKTEFADIEADLYEQLAIEGQLKTLDALSLQKAVDCVELASKRLESYVITHDVKSVVIAMLMLDIKLEYRKFSSICPRLVGKKVSELGYRAMFLKFFDLVEREIERYDNKKAPSTDIANPITALENHIQQEVAKEVKKVVGPVNSIIQLLMNDYAFLTSVSGVTRLLDLGRDGDHYWGDLVHHDPGTALAARGSAISSGNFLRANISRSLSYRPRPERSRPPR